MGMREAGEDASFTPEALLAATAEQGDVQELDRRASLEAPVTALGEPDAPHAALTDRRHQGVGAQGLSGKRRLAGQRDWGVLEKAFLRKRAMLIEKRLELGG